MRKRSDIHTPRASGDPPALLQALKLALSGVLSLALHIVVVVIFAPGADEKRSRHQRGRSGTKLFDLGNRVGQRGGVDEDMLVEAAETQIVSSLLLTFKQTNWFPSWTETVEGRRTWAFARPSWRLYDCRRRRRLASGLS